MSIQPSPIALTLSTQLTLPLPGVTMTQIDWIVFSNNSPFVLQVVCGGILFHVPAWYFYPLPLITTGNRGEKVRLFTVGNEVDITPIQQTIPGSAFTAQLFYTIYLNNETPPQTVPSPLGGGPVDLTVASQIISTNQPAGNVIVFGEPTGDTNPTGPTNLNNQGQLVLGDTVYNGSIAILGPDTANMSLTRLALNLFSALGAQDITIASGVITLNGSTSGTAVLIMPFRGTFKLLCVQMTNFRNGSAPAQTISLPVNFTTAVHGWNSGCGLFQLLKGGLAQTVQQLTGFTAGADNSTSPQATIHQNWLWHLDGGFDTISFNGSDAGAHGAGQIIMFGE